MPLYQLKCEVCGSEVEVLRKIAEMDDLPTCVCKGKMFRVLTAPAVHTDISPYQSPGTGKWITSRSEQREDLKRSNSFLYEPGVKDDIARNKIHTQEKAFTPIAAAVDQTVAALVQSGKLES
jgi:putative FmdB family regulatory protein